MITYTTLKDRPREFLTATGLTHEEFLRLLPAFETAYTACYPLDKTWHGKARQRQVGGGATGRLAQMEDKVLFILVSPKTVLYDGIMDSSFWYTPHKQLFKCQAAIGKAFKHCW
jgi:hypothetical protein